MDKIRKWDLWILDNVFQPIADKIWEWADVSCFNLARCCTVVYGGLCVFYTMNYEEINKVFAYGVEGFLCAICFMMIWIEESRQHRKFMNFAREFLWATRVLWFVPLAVDVLRIMAQLNTQHLTLFFMGFFLLAVVEFVSCQTRPPVERRQPNLVPEGA